MVALAIASAVRNQAQHNGFTAYPNQTLLIGSSEAFTWIILKDYVWLVGLPEYVYYINIYIIYMTHPDGCVFWGLLYHASG